MTFEIGLVFGLTAIAVVLFATGKLPTDLVAAMVMLALQLTGVLTPEEALAGFANTATVTVAAMFVLGAGVFRTGAISFVGTMLERLARRSTSLMLAALMAGIGVLSSFLNNTAAVAVLIPVTLGVARRSKVSASKLLMPLSYASMFGGVCTLLGTSTNILGNSIAVRQGQPPFGMFEFSKLGLLFAAAGGAYMLLIGVRLIPNRRPVAGMVDSFHLSRYLTEVVLEPTAASVGKRLDEAPLLKELDVEVLRIQRGVDRFTPAPDIVLRADDVLQVLCDVVQITKVQQRVGVRLRAGVIGDEELKTNDTVLLEAIVAPNSMFSGRTLGELRFHAQFGAVVLAIRHRGELTRGHLDLEHIRLGPADTLLMLVPRDQLEHLKGHRAFLVVSEPDVPTFRRHRATVALTIAAGVMAAAATGLVPISIAAVLGALLMVVSGVLEPDEAYSAIDGKVLVLLACLLALGAAMEKTGAARLIAAHLVSAVGGHGPHALLAALFLFTLLLTEVMSNNATVALLMPIAIDTAQSMQVSPRPFLFAVMYAASSSFMTPVGYQTNTMIYGPGQYRFSDFLRVGAPLNLLFWVLGSLLIPVFWPF